MAVESDPTVSWIARVTRAGWLSKGFVFVVIGAIALRIATTRWEQPDEDASQRGALRVVSAQPFGGALLALVAAGLVVFMVWNVTQAVIADSTDLDLLGVAKRVGWFGLGLFYGALALAGFRMVLSDQPSSSGSTEGDTDPTALTARLLAADGGRVVALVVAVVVVVVAGYQLRKGLTYDFVDDLDTDDLDPDQKERLGRLGVGGFVARAFVFAMVAFFLAKAAIEFDPTEAVGLDGALRELASVGYGRFLILLVGIGLMLAGTYDMVTFRRQRLR